MINLKLRPNAEIDVDSALAFYFDRNPRSAIDLLQELDVAFDRIRENPTQFPFVEEPVRRVLLRKFPYTVYFVSEGNTVNILAVVHQRQHPDRWKRHGGP